MTLGTTTSPSIVEKDTTNHNDSHSSSSSSSSGGGSIPNQSNNKNGETSIASMEQHLNHNNNTQQEQQQQQHFLGARINKNGGRNSSTLYDVTGTMDRLRSSLMGDMSESKWIHSLHSNDDLQNNNNNHNHNSIICDIERRGLLSLPEGGIDQHYDSICNNNIDDDVLNDEEMVSPIATTKTTTTNGCNRPSNDNIHQQQQLDSSIQKENPLSSSSSSFVYTKKVTTIQSILHQIPAVVLIGMFHLMMGIPFGVSYFPIGWKTIGTTDNNVNNDQQQQQTTTSLDANDTIHGPFPIPGKEQLGIRMFLFATIIGQLIFTFHSGFHNPISIQMVENVPFCHELSKIAIQYQGYSREALSTVYIMFGVSSIVVGIVFYVLGRYELGRVIYYFPKHVLVGCIGGIGIFIMKTGFEVTMDTIFTIVNCYRTRHLLMVVLVFEIILRFIEKITRDPITKNAKYPLLAPIYFCSITPIFYILLYLLGVPIQEAITLGYFFPHLDYDNNNNVTNNDTNNDIIANNSNGLFNQIYDMIFDKDTFSIFTIINVSTVSIPALIHAIPTMIALILFSLIHVPINIPAFAISSNISDEINMNTELIAHGYSNMLSGLFGGLQNYMAYTQSVLYYKSGGYGKGSGVAVAILTMVLFIIGPTIASYIPRCMAGCLLLHVGFDLFLEGVYDSYGKFDLLEYAGIWLITLVMTFYGMEAAMIAGFIAAISTYTVQNTAYVNPIRGTMPATTLRSSHFQRNPTALQILSDPLLGRSRIFVIQLQGHLFFGNMAQLTESINDAIREQYNHNHPNQNSNNNSNSKSSMNNRGMNAPPFIVIIDCALVLGIDSSAAQAIGKLQTTLQRNFQIDLCIFVTGSISGFPTNYNLTKELSASTTTSSLITDAVVVGSTTMDYIPNEMTGLLYPPKVPQPSTYKGSHVFISLDEALVFAENALIVKYDSTVLDQTEKDTEKLLGGAMCDRDLSIEEEQEIALMNLTALAPQGTEPDILQQLLDAFVRDPTCYQTDYIWKQGSRSTCAKLLVRGTLMSILEDEAGTNERIAHGNILGELGLIEGTDRMSSVVTVSDMAVLYSLSRTKYEQLVHEQPKVARIMDIICIRYLSVRVQHVSNRIFETRCLPI